MLLQPVTRKFKCVTPLIRCASFKHCGWYFLEHFFFSWLHWQCKSMITTDYLFVFSLCNFYFYRVRCICWFNLEAKKIFDIWLEAGSLLFELSCAKHWRRSSESVQSNWVIERLSVFVCDTVSYQKRRKKNMVIIFWGFACVCVSHISV